MLAIAAALAHLRIGPMMSEAERSALLAQADAAAEYPASTDTDLRAKAQRTYKHFASCFSGKFVLRDGIGRRRRQFHARRYLAQEAG